MNVRKRLAASQTQLLKLVVSFPIDPVPVAHGWHSKWGCG